MDVEMRSKRQRERDTDDRASFTSRGWPRTKNRPRLIALALLGMATLRANDHTAAAEEIPFSADLAGFRVEQAAGGSVRARDGALVIEDQLGCTVWLTQTLRAPVEITYDVTVVARGGPHDRVSDVNCFWMASEVDGSAPAVRSGRFFDYDRLRLYYVGMGGNDNTSTRFRRYDGTGAKPLLPEHDRREPAVRLEGNRTYHIRLIARDGVAEFWRDGQRIFLFKDPQPLRTGWFGFRTLHSHLEIRNLRIRAEDGGKLGKSETRKVGNGAAPTEDGGRRGLKLRDERVRV